MANIDHYLEDIEVASRGEEVRDSIIDAFEALNSEGPGTMAWNNITGTPDTLTGYGVSDVPASMVSGVLALNNIPPSALERVVPVANDTARFALTSSDVQNGDTVKVLSTMKLYLVVDDTSLSTEAGYEEYKAGTADSVDWSGVLNTPETLAGYGIEDAYTKDEVDDITTSEEEESDAGNPITIETDAAQYAKKTHLTLEPVQDLRGYDHPWPAGGGKNLFDEQYPNIDGSMRRIYVQTGDGTFTLSTTALIVEGSANLFLQTGQATSGESTASNGVYSGTPRTVTATDGYVTISYRIVNNTTDAGNPLKCKTQLEVGSTATSYEPYSNICPITGVDEVEVKTTGKNLLNIDDVSNGYNLDTNTGLPVVFSGRCCLMEPIDVKNISRVAISFTSNVAETFVIYALLKDGVLVDRNPGRTSGMTIDTTNGDELYLCWYATNGNVDKANLSNVQVELGSAATDYEPYTEYAASLDLPEEVYSGTLDLETGEVVADMGMTKIGDFSWSTQQSSYGKFVCVGIPSNIKKDANALVAICDAYKGYSDALKPPNVDGIYVSSAGQFKIYDSRYDLSQINDWATEMANTKIVYLLETPITYQLTPQQLALFKGINNISTNAKTVQVTYRNGELATTGDIVTSTEVAKRSILDEAASDADAKLATSLAPILGNFATAETSPASASHAVGEYLLYNNRLYKVLAAISAGQQLTIGTNIGQTNVAAELASQAGAISALNSNWVYLNSSDYASHEAYLRAIVSVTSVYKPYIVSSKTSGSSVQIGMFIKKDNNNAEMLIAYDSAIRMYYLNNNTFSEYTCAKKSD